MTATKTAATNGTNVTKKKNVSKEGLSAVKEEPSNAVKDQNVKTKEKGCMPFFSGHLSTTKTECLKTDKPNQPW